MSDFGSVIYSYTRSQAIADGFLIDISKISKEAGFRIPVAVSDNLYHRILNPNQSLKDQGQSLEGRIWDMLTMLRLSIKTRQNSSRLAFKVLFIMIPEKRPSSITIILTISPGDNGEPAMTLFLPEDD